MSILIYMLPAWLIISIAGYLATSNKKDNIKIMSCRKILKKFKKLDEADNKSIF